ncbi:Guanine nucleotide-binding proteinsubunit gamma-1 [Toxocara canis]|uniref:Guanine nucleotide-binding protein subunit gamma n=2 Tax=Toxocara canis TaxID=6265 RepID=A0A0B2UYR0_TOXCA|nr:Guanine nucleotide-binding proteinsubunit gamma-1 [Toxocara canis]
MCVCACVRDLYVYNNIRPEHLKAGGLPLFKALAVRFSRYLREKKTPAAWKKSRTILLMKKGDPENHSNYRPITSDLLAMSGRDLHSLQQARKVVEQLRRERNIRRGLVSQSANDLIRYTQEYQKEDVLLTSFPNDKMNPFRPKSSFQCMLL